jgi:hypothetical protein
MKTKSIKPKTIHAFDDEPEFITDSLVWRNRSYVKLRSGPTVYFVVDSYKNICEFVQIKEHKDGKREESSKTKLALFSISDLIEYPPIYELKTKPMFSLNIRGANEYEESFKPASIDEIVAELKSRGLFLQSGRALDIITNAINALKVNMQYTVAHQSPYPGFFILNDQFVSTESYNKPNKGQIVDALNIFNEFGESYGDFRPKLGYIVHWMLMAPFSFILKQKGAASKINNMHLYGTTRTGKTTIAKLVSFFWNRNSDEQLTSGSHVHSTYQYGRAISRSTFPIVIDEGEAIFQSDELKSMLKTSTHNISARSRYNSSLQQEEEIMALSQSIITSNYSKPNDGAVGARLDLFKYTANEVRSKKAREKFENKFQPDVQNGPLHVLKYIGNYVATRIKEDPDLLNDDWLKLSKRLWKEIYQLARMPMPEWMSDIALPDSVEESFEDEISYYESNIKALILRNAAPNIYENGKESKFKEYITPIDKAMDVVKNAREPWIHLHQPQTGKDAGKRFVLIEKSIETDLKKDRNIDIQLDRIAEILNGEIARKTFKNKKRKYAVFDYDEFLDMF